MRWFGERHLVCQLAVVGNENHALAHLWHAVKGGIQQRVAAHIAFLFQDLADFFGDVLASMVQYVGYVFNDDDQRRKGFDVAQVLDIELGTRVVLEGLSVLVDLAQLRPPDARKCLARRSADEYIESVRRLAQFQLTHQVVRLRARDVTGHRMRRVAAMKIVAVRSCRFCVELYGRSDREACCRKAER